MLTRAKLRPIPKLMDTRGKEAENPDKEVRGFLHCWQLATNSKDAGNQVHRIVQCSVKNEPRKKLVVLIPPSWHRPVWPRTLVEATERTKH